MHWLPAQQGDDDDGVADGVPHTTHRFELLQIVLAAVQVLPEQQGWPAPPQGTQVAELDELLLQAVPGSRQEATPEDVQQG